VPRHLVCDVNESRVGAPLNQNCLHRGDVIIFESEVGGESDDGAMRSPHG
jgi:hypothetical protein